MWDRASMWSNPSNQLFLMFHLTDLKHVCVELLKSLERWQTCEPKRVHEHGIQGEKGCEKRALLGKVLSACKQGSQWQTALSFMRLWSTIRTFVKPKLIDGVYKTVLATPDLKNLNSTSILAKSASLIFQDRSNVTFPNMKYNKYKK